MIGYIDSSTVVDRVLAITRGEDVERTEAPPFNRWVSSEITVVEVHRVLRRTGIDQALDELVESALMTVEVLNLASPTMRLAASLPVRFLESQDAIHLASALLVRADVVLTRDRQMQRACQELGLRVA